jgi:hypothetical protein
LHERPRRSCRACNLLTGSAAYKTARRLYEGERVDYRDAASVCVIAISGRKCNSRR